MTNYKGDNQFCSVKLSTILIILLVPLTLPNHLVQVVLIQRTIELLVVFIFIVLFLLTLMQKKLNLFIAVSFIFIIWRIFSSFVLSEGITDLTNSIRILSLVLLINLSIKKHTYSVLRALALLFNSYVLINFATLIIFMEGIYIENPRPGVYRGVWFLGIDNEFALYIIPAIIFTLLFSWYKNKKITLFSWVLVAISTVTIFITLSATAVVALLFVLISLFLLLRKKSSRIYSFYTLTVFYVVIWFSIIRINSLELFRFFIVELLNKDLTLSGRTRIWDVVWDYIPQSLWYGYGINFKVMLTKTYFVAHNLFLQLTLESGLIGLFLFFICFIVGGVKLQKNKKNFVAVLLVIGIFGILIGGLTEAYILNYLFIFLVLAYNVEFIILNLNEKVLWLKR